MATIRNKVKSIGQVFTPNFIVTNILDYVGYVGVELLQKHIIDNSCGDGAFVCEIVRRYCRVYLQQSTDKQALAKELATYIHGIEIEESTYADCLKNLKEIESEFELPPVVWDIRLGNTLTIDCYHHQMDFVVGNPPYVRVHNLEGEYARVKQYAFANGGMTDLYLVFFEIGINMLKEGGRLGYITPSSWLNSLAGQPLRDYLQRTQCLSSVVDLAHFQAFQATTYTIITLLEKGQHFPNFDYYSYDGEQQVRVFEDKLPFEMAFIQGNLYLSKREDLQQLSIIQKGSFQRFASVKNGFATLADSIFISKDLDFDEYVIPIIKASTGKWSKALFPYDTLGKPYSKEELWKMPKVATYLEKNKIALLKGLSEEDKRDWYLYGRTQALKDVYKKKVAINTTIKHLDSIKINDVKPGEGVYSGLYVLGVDYKTVESILRTENFLAYIRSLKKYKSGGYYTFNSKDVEVYLNYHLQQLLKQKSENEQQPILEYYLDFV